MASSVIPELAKLDIIKQDTESASHKVFQELAIKSAQPHADRTFLTDRAVIGMEPMEDMPHTAHLLNSEHLAMAFTELSAAMDDPFDVFPLPSYTYDPSKPCYLYTIPRELRDMVYDDVISSGNLKILRTSRKLHEEGINFLYKRRVCHLIEDFTKYRPAINLQEPIAALIQNVDIEIVMGSSMNGRCWGDTTDPILKFGGSTVLRQTCRLVFLCTEYYHPFNTKPRLEKILGQLRTLNGFLRVILEFHYKCPMLVGEHQPLHCRQKAISILRADKHLEKNLGPSTWREDVDPTRQYLEFHPRAHLEANQGGVVANDPVPQ